MADNDASKTSATKPKQAESVIVAGKVTINTDTFEPTQPILLDQAVDAFKAQVAQTHGDKPLTDVTVNIAQHIIGFSATYDVTGKVAG